MDAREQNVMGASDKPELAQSPPERRNGKKSPISAMQALAALAIVAVLAVAFLYFTQTQGEKELTRDEFKALLNSSSGVAVIQDLGAIPAGDAATRLKAQNCGVQLSFTLSNLGRFRGRRVLRRPGKRLAPSLGLPLRN
jgi:hypothetical protein